MRKLTEAYLQALVEQQTEEALALEYKGAAALSRSDSAKREITKDISAMANAAGGRIIFGIREHSDAAKRHLPECIDPCNRREFSKEWLEQVAAAIQPRIDGLLVTPVPLSTNDDHVAYVVDVPQSATAHQASDLRYYRRHNFESVPMYDYEIRDVMNRSRHPRLVGHAFIEIELVTLHPALPGLGETRKEMRYSLILEIEHAAGPLARFVNGFVDIPFPPIAEKARVSGRQRKKGRFDYLSFAFANTKRDVVDIGGTYPFSFPKHGPSWFDPILPGTRHRLFTVALDETQVLTGSYGPLSWTIHADSAPSIAQECTWHGLEHRHLPDAA